MGSKLKTVSGFGKNPTTIPIRAKDRFGGVFEVVRPIASSDESVVYLGRDIESDEPVAIKVQTRKFHPGDELVERFLRGIEAVQALTNPNCVRIYGSGMTRHGLIYMAMEYVDGPTLAECLRKDGPLSVDRLGWVANEVLICLDEAHRKGIVHRDIKPQNLILCTSGEREQIKVLDFGVARYEGSISMFKTRKNALIGTPHYMSPEQIRCHTITPASDIYSLGITLFELATGATPYESSNLLEIAAGHMSDAPIKLPRKLSWSALGKTLKKALKKAPEQRYQSASEMLTSLQR
jgi:serine/threonine-protein kinase